MQSQVADSAAGDVLPRHADSTTGDALLRSVEGALVVVNPVARNGAGKKAAAWLGRELGDAAYDRVELATTAGPGHATELAAAAAGRSLVVACGGDGLAHEVLQGLMRIPAGERPAFALLPCGNGDDFARTVGMPRDGVESAWRALESARPRAFDVGVCNGVHFLQTLSFGVDAAIALGTQERRARTGHEGTRLFLEEGVHQLWSHRDSHECRIEFADAHGTLEETFEGQVHLLAVQLGPTYGGGFAVCPEASPEDGAFDVCACRAPLGFLRAAYLFLRAKNGRHVRYARDFFFHRAPSLRIEFDRALPTQIDGERLDGSSFDVRTLPAALKVLVL